MRWSALLRLTVKLRLRRLGAAPEASDTLRITTLAVPPSGRQSSDVRTMVPATSGRAKSAYALRAHLANPSPFCKDRPAERAAQSALAPSIPLPSSALQQQPRRYSASNASYPHQAMPDRLLAGLLFTAGKHQTPTATPAGTAASASCLLCRQNSVPAPPAQEAFRPRLRLQAVALHPTARLPGLPQPGGCAGACAPLMSTVLTRKSDSAAANSCPVDACRTLETAAGAPAAAAQATATSAAHNSRPVRGPAGRRGIVGPGRVQREGSRASPAARTGAAKRLGSGKCKHLRARPALAPRSPAAPHRCAALQPAAARHSRKQAPRRTRRGELSRGTPPKFPAKFGTAVRKAALFGEMFALHRQTLVQLLLFQPAHLMRRFEHVRFTSSYTRRCSSVRPSRQRSMFSHSSCAYS